MKKFYLLISFCLCMALVAHSQIWQSVGPNDFNQLSPETATYTCMALGGTGNLYVAYNDGGLASKATVKKFNSATSTWDLVGMAGFSAGSANYMSIAIGANDTPYVSYRDGLAANGNKLTVMKFDGTAWVPVGGVAFSTGGASYTSLAFDGSGAPYVAYSDATDRVTVKKFESGAWSTVGTAGLSAGAATYISLAFNGGMPYVAYRDGSGGKGWLKKFEGGAWSIVGGVAFSAGGASYNSLAFNSSGTPYIAYQDASILPAGSNKLTVMKFEAGSWATVGTTGFSAGAASHIALAVNGSGIPYVGYQDGATSNKLTVKKFEAGAWSTVGTDGFSAFTASYSSMVVDGSSNPYIAFCDAGNGNKATVRKFDGTAWTPLGTGFSLAQATNISLVMNGGTPYIAFKDFGYGNKAMVKKFESGAWTSVGPSTGFTTAGAGYTSLAFNAMGIPYVAYQDASTTPTANKATLSKFEGGVWTAVGGAGFSTTNVLYTSLAMNSSGTPYVAFQDGTGGKATVMKYESGAWTTVGGAGFSEGAATWISLVMDGIGTPYVAYNDATNGKVTCMKFNNTSSNWEAVGPAIGFSQSTASYISLALDGSGKPYVAYQNIGTPAINKLTVMKFDGTNWNTVGTADFSAASTTLFSSLVVDGNTPYVAFRDATTGIGNKATVLKFDGTNWVPVGGAGLTSGPATNTVLALNGSELFLAYSSNGGDGFAKSITTLTTLPLKLLSFRANRSGNAALLNWTTASEENTAYFEVQRSVDGSFTKTGTVNAHNRAGTQNYGFTDAGFAGLNMPVVFYRLKMVDVDGNFTFSSIAAVSAPQGQASATIYPNPVRDLANVVLTAKASEKIAWQLLDASGKTVMNGSYTLSAGRNELTVATTALSAGQYTLVIDGAVTHAQVKIMKQ